MAQALQRGSRVFAPLTPGPGDPVPRRLPSPPLSSSLLVVAALASCAPISGPSSDGGTLEDGGSGAPSIDACSSDPRWSAGRALPSARDHHGTFITTGATPKLHVTGGNTYQGVLAEHWEADILDDGSLGEWREGAALPAPQAGHAVAQVGDHVLLVSGRDATGFRARVLVSNLDDNADITGWREVAPLPVARFHASAATAGDVLYVTGGLTTDGTATDSVFSARVAEDGTISSWSQLSPLPAPRSHHASFVLDGHLYVSFGFEGNAFQNATTGHKDILRAELLDEGGLGPWETALDFDLDISTQAATVTGDCVYLVGGLVKPSSGALDYNALVYRLGYEAGALEDPVATARPLSTGRSHMHQAPYFRGRLYAVGGSRALQDVTADVEIGAFD